MHSGTLLEQSVKGGTWGGGAGWDLNINFNSIYFYIKRWKIFHQLCTRATDNNNKSSRIENNNKNKKGK